MKQEAEALKRLEALIDQHLADISAAGKLDDHEFIFKTSNNLVWAFTHFVASMESTEEGGDFVRLARKALKPSGREYFDALPDLIHVLYREVDNEQDYTMWCPKTGDHNVPTWAKHDEHWICEGCQAVVIEGGSR